MAEFRSIGARPDDTRGTTAAEVRKGIAGLLTGPGVLPGSSSPLVQGTSGFAYQVNAAAWATPGGAGGGLHLWGNDGPKSVPTDPAPASGLSRIDIVYALHPSATENGDTTSQPVIGVAKGTPASAPVAPSIPPRAIELGRNTMTSAATNTSGGGNNIAQSAPVAELATRATLHRATNGVTTVSVNSSGDGTRSVALPPGRFPVTPVVVATLHSGAGANAAANVRVSTISTSEFTVVVNNAAPSTTVPVGWIAQQVL